MKYVVTIKCVEKYEDLGLKEMALTIYDSMESADKQLDKIVGNLADSGREITVNKTGRIHYVEARIKGREYPIQIWTAQYAPVRTL